MRFYNFIKLSSIFLAASVVPTAAWAALPQTSENGQVCEVTTAVDGNVLGSLRRALEAYNLNDSDLPSYCKKAIVFKVGGTITLKETLKLSNPTGQGGFTLKKDPAVTQPIILDASGVGQGNCGIEIDTQNVKIENIIVANAPEGGICIKSGANSIELNQVVVSDSKNGVVVNAGSQGNVIQDGSFYGNTEYGILLQEATGNRATQNALYRNDVGALSSVATQLKPVITSAGPQDALGTQWVVAGQAPNGVSEVELYRKALRLGEITNYLGKATVASGTFTFQVPGLNSDEVFVLGFSSDGTTSEPSDSVLLTTLGGGNGGEGERPCAIGIEPAFNADWDEDGILDKYEDKNKNCQVDPGETDPANSDTDGDGLKDGIEDRNKNGEIDPQESDPTRDDTDQDFIKDGIEDKNQNGIRDAGELDPTKEDTDDDGIRDNIEDKDMDGVFDEGTETNGANADTDFDGISDGVEDQDKNGVFDKFRESDPKKGDSDDDGTSDSTDPCPTVPYSTCKEPCIPGQEPDIELDSDNDNIPDFFEDKDHSCGLGNPNVGDPDVGETNPYKKDTDGDGRIDGLDVCPNDPNPDCEPVCDPELINDQVDSDGDGLSNLDEDPSNVCFVDPGESDPYNPDSDGDGKSDGTDACPLDSNPLCDTPCQFGVEPPEGQDSDGDGIADSNEDINNNCGQDANETDFRKRDSDGDGFNDNVDSCPLNADPACTKECVPGEYIAPERDSDRDSLKDVVEDTNRNCIRDVGETDAYNKDTDGDGIADGIEDKNQNGLFEDGEADPRNPDTDGDGILDGIEDKNFNGIFGEFNECNPTKTDTDDDGILDFNEDKNQNGQLDGDETNCAQADTDRDGLADGAEDKNGNGAVDAGETDSRKADSDGDGVADGQEVSNGTNPILSSSGDLNRALGQGCALQPGVIGGASAWVNALWMGLLGLGAFFRKRSR